MDEKAKPAVTVDVHEVSDAFGHSTANDQRDMRRMGKKQEFVRSFHIVTSIAFTSCVMGTWELLLATSSPALIAGGTSGLFWSCVWGYIGQSFIVLSLAEMSSMAPTAGGQYHWVSRSRVARRQALNICRRCLSLLPRDIRRFGAILPDGLARCVGSPLRLSAASCAGRWCRV